MCVFTRCTQNGTTLAFKRLSLRLAVDDRLVNTERIEQIWVAPSKARIDDDINYSLYLQFAGSSGPFEFHVVNPQGEIVMDPLKSVGRRDKLVDDALAYLGLDS